MRRFAIALSVLPLAFVGLAACFPTFEFGTPSSGADAGDDAVSDDGAAESAADDATDATSADAPVDEDAESGDATADDAG
jgi:hypothetical protein